MPHLELAKEHPYHFPRRGLVVDAQSLVLDVRAQTPGVDLDGYSLVGHLDRWRRRQLLYYLLLFLVAFTLWLLAAI